MMWACCTAPAVAAMLMTGVSTASASPTTFQPPTQQGPPGGFFGWQGGQGQSGQGGQGQGGQGGQGQGQGGQGQGHNHSSCSKWQLEQWNLNGSNVVTLTFNGGSYSYNVVLTQKGSCLTGTLTDTHASPTLSLPITGTVSGSDVVFSVTYPTGVQKTRTFTGKVSRHGAVSGTWAETGTENGSGPWSLTTKADPACPTYHHSFGGQFGHQRECKVK
jgi:hypothetical protein